MVMRNPFIHAGLRPLPKLRVVGSSPIARSRRKPRYGGFFRALTRRRGAANAVWSRCGQVASEFAAARVSQASPRSFARRGSVDSLGMADKDLSLRTCDEVLAFLRDYEPRDATIEELEGTIRLQRNLVAVAEQAEREAEGPPPPA